MRWLLAFALAGAAFADPLVLDDAMLVSLARTREPEVRISYAADRVELRTRRSALVAWIDVLLVARFERRGDRVQLVAQSLRTGGIAQKGKRFEQAKAGLARLVDVYKPSADRVEVFKDGKRVYVQDLGSALRNESADSTSEGSGGRIAPE